MADVLKQFESIIQQNEMPDNYQTHFQKTREDVFVEEIQKKIPRKQVFLHDHD